MADISFQDGPLQQGLQVLEARTKITAILIWIVIALDLLVALGELSEAAGIIDLASANAGAAELIVGLASIGWLIAFAISVVVVGMWIHRAHANLFAAGIDELEFSPGWSVGWFFVPIANLFKPFQAMRELVNTSNGLSNSFGGEAPGDVKVWWGCYIIGNIVSTISLRIQLNAGPDGVAAAALTGFISSILTAASAWFLLKIVRDVMEAQRSHLGVNATFA